MNRAWRQAAKIPTNALRISFKAVRVSPCFVQEPSPHAPDPAQAETVKTLAQRHFGADAALWLFGSRADDRRRGGDYDFFIETSLDQPDAIIEHKIALIVELQSSPAFEDEKIDLVVKRRHSDFHMPIYDVAQTEGIRL